MLGDTRLRSDQVHANAGDYRQFAEGLAQRLRELGLLARGPTRPIARRRGSCGVAQGR
ncbi:MAG: hypothetical protein WA917_06570 [Comamonas sp.]